MKKLTKRDLFGMLLAVEGVAADATLVEFITKEVELIEKKAEKSKTYKKKKDEDTLKVDVLAALGDEFRITSDITEDLKVDYEDVTAAKITARLTALVKEGLVVKESIKVDKRTLMGYKVA